MVKKEQSISIEELTKKEISVVDAEDKLAKFEKAAARDKKIIAEYKEREKASARALVLFERKLKYLKTPNIPRQQIKATTKAILPDILPLRDSIIRAQKYPISTVTLIRIMYWGSPQA